MNHLNHYHHGSGGGMPQYRQYPDPGHYSYYNATLQGQSGGRAFQMNAAGQFVPRNDPAPYGHAPPNRAPVGPHSPQEGSMIHPFYYMAQQSPIYQQQVHQQMPTARHPYPAAYMPQNMTQVTQPPNIPQYINTTSSEAVERLNTFVRELERPNSLTEAPLPSGKKRKRQETPTRPTITPGVADCFITQVFIKPKRIKTEPDDDPQNNASVDGNDKPQNNPPADGYDEEAASPGVVYNLVIPQASWSPASEDSGICDTSVSGNSEPQQVLSNNNNNNSHIETGNNNSNIYYSNNNITSLDPQPTVCEMNTYLNNDNRCIEPPRPDSGVNPDINPLPDTSMQPIQTDGTNINTAILIDDEDADDEGIFLTPVDNKHSLPAGGGGGDDIKVYVSEGIITITMTSIQT